MIGRSLLAGAFLVAFSAPALAFRCPVDIRTVDAALTESTLSGSEKAEMTRLRDEGAAQHEAGNHQAAVDALAKAIKLIPNSY